MKPTIRMVCGDCLRSVELYADEAKELPPLCPYCGGTIESQGDEEAGETRDRTRLLPDEPPSGETTPWVETWSKGTLGTIGRFQLRELLGDGGFGQVFLAYDPRLDRDVALKVLKQTDPGERIMERFFREARAAARLDHANIVGVYDAGHDVGRCWIAYQYVRGRTLVRLCDHQPPGRVESARMIRDLADALDHAHRAGVFHRDLKPTNIIIDDRGRPRLTDFGLARRADLDSDLTRDGAILGTPAYMSPEQASGRSHQADERSDVYSLGVIFFELLCGRRPANIPSGAPAWMARPKPGVTPPPPRSINRSIPPALDRICRTALAPDPARRYPNARALADEIDAWLIAQQGGRLSHPLVCAVLGIAAALLMMVGVRAAFEPGGVPRPPLISAPPAATSPKPEAEPASAAEAKPKPEAEPVAAKPAQPPAAGTEAKAEVTAAIPATESVKLIGNRNSRIFHLPDCPNGPLKNRAELSSIDEALKEGYKACSYCTHRLGLPIQGPAHATAQ